MRRLSPWVIDNRPRQFRPRRRAPRPLVVPPPRPLAPTVDDARLAAWLQRGWGPGAPPYDRVTFRRAWTRSATSASRCVARSSLRSLPRSAVWAGRARYDSRRVLETCMSLTVTAIDPGPELSAYCTLVDGTPFDFAKLPNAELLERLPRLPGELVVEMIASYGMGVGAEVLRVRVDRAPHRARPAASPGPAHPPRRQDPPVPQRPRHRLECPSCPPGPIWRHAGRSGHAEGSWTPFRPVGRLLGGPGARYALL